MLAHVRWLLLGALIALPGSLVAQPFTTSLTGEVLGDIGALPGVTVTLEGLKATEGVRASAVTDREGRFEFVNVPPGEYVVRAEIPGFATVRRNVTLTAGTQPSRLQLHFGGETAAPDETPGPVEPTEHPFTIVRVFYGTDRQHIAAPRAGSDYAAARGALTLGTCTVSIPKDHRLGDWERPTILELGVEDQARHVVLLSVTPRAEAEFVQRLQARVASSAQKEAFVFVHGYNVTFRDAVQRTAILAYDLKFDGAPILFSWPSRGKYGQYLADEESIQYAVPHIEAFLSLVARSSGATRIHLIAHSMGNRALLRAVANLRLAGRAPANIGHAVLTAPDVDRDVFTQLVESVRLVARRTTLYASSKDRAIRASRRVHDGARAGEGGSRILVTEGVDSVDVSALDTSFLGHSYHAENRSVITDLFELLHGDRGPDQRVCLSSRTRAARKHWVFDRCRLR